jgi:hypothetical protein
MLTRLENRSVTGTVPNNQATGGGTTSFGRKLIQRRHSAKFGGSSDGGEIEVFRLALVKGKKYQWAEATRKTKGRYYAPTNALKTVGTFKASGTSGWGDGAENWEVFQSDDGSDFTVNHSYSGKTCFRELGQTD